MQSRFSLSPEVGTGILYEFSEDIIVGISYLHNPKHDYLKSRLALQAVDYILYTFRLETKLPNSVLSSRRG